MSSKPVTASKKSNSDKDEKPFLRVVLGLDKEAVHIDQKEPEAFLEPKVLPIGITVNGRTYRGELVLESFGGTLTPDYRCYFRADTSTTNLVEDEPPLRAHPKLGPEYVIGSDGHPILRSALQR